MARFLITTTKPLFIALAIIALISILYILNARDTHTTTPVLQPQNDTVFGAQTTQLENGLKIFVVPNNRAKIISHMLWIGAGGADEPESVSGVAHFLEHLMFKGTPTTAPGDYSKQVALWGGDENAFTSQDYTAYYATIPSDHLEDLMKLESDRFKHLAPPQSDIMSEKQVIIEERRQRTDNDPLGPFYEQMNAYLFASTPYDNPIIGWSADMEKLTWDDVTAFKNRWYTPKNMALVISGDVTFDRAVELARKYYGDLPVSPDVSKQRLSPPPQRASTTLTYTSDKIDQAEVIIGWRAPTYREDKKRGLALDVLQETIAGGASTYLYQDLVVKKKLATSIDLSYAGDSWSGGAVWISATPAIGVTLPDLTAAIFAELDTLAVTITDDDRAAAVKRMQRSATFARDSVSGPAMIIGAAITTGQTLDDVEHWPQHIAAVTLDEVRAGITDLLRCNITSPTCAPPIIGHVIARDPNGTATPHVSIPQGITQ